MAWKQSDWQWQDEAPETSEGADWWHDEAPEASEGADWQWHAAPEASAEADWQWHEAPEASAEAKETSSEEEEEDDDKNDSKGGKDSTKGGKQSAAKGRNKGGKSSKGGGKGPFKKTRRSKKKKGHKQDANQDRRDRRRYLQDKQFLGATHSALEDAEEALATRDQELERTEDKVNELQKQHLALLVEHEKKDKWARASLENIRENFARQLSSRLATLDELQSSKADQLVWMQGEQDAMLNEVRKSKNSEISALLDRLEAVDLEAADAQQKNDQQLASLRSDVENYKAGHLQVEAESTVSRSSGLTQCH